MQRWEAGADLDDRNDQDRQTLTVAVTKAADQLSRPDLSFQSSAPPPGIAQGSTSSPSFTGGGGSSIPEIHPSMSDAESDIFAAGDATESSFVENVSGVLFVESRVNCLAHRLIAVHAA
jgi:hypothetical protein